MGMAQPGARAGLGESGISEQIDSTTSSTSLVHSKFKFVDVFPFKLLVIEEMIKAVVA